MRDIYNAFRDVLHLSYVHQLLRAKLRINALGAIIYARQRDSGFHFLQFDRGQRNIRMLSITGKKTIRKQLENYSRSQG